MAQTIPASIIEILNEKPNKRFRSCDIEDMMTTRHNGPAFSSIDTICSTLNTLAKKKKIRRFQVYGLDYKYEYQAL